MMNFSLVVRLLLVLSISSIFYSFTYIKDQPYVVILGVAQDGGAPHAACEKSCCIHKWNDPTLHNKVSSIGIVDPISNEVWMIDATPDFAEQLHLLTNNNFNFEIKSFFNNFDHILSKTNIALCRSGAGTINDLINYKIPAIILPLPSSKNNHQFENAKILSEIGCAILADKDSKELDKILLFIRNVIDDKSFNNSLLDKYSKIKRYNTNLLMWKHIHDDQ